MRHENANTNWQSPTRPIQSPNPLRRANFRARGTLLHGGIIINRDRREKHQPQIKESRGSFIKTASWPTFLQRKTESLVQRKQIKGHRVHQHPSPLVLLLLGSSQRAFCLLAWHLWRFEYALPAITCNSKAFWVHCHWLHHFLFFTGVETVAELDIFPFWGEGGGVLGSHRSSNR